MSSFPVGARVPEALLSATPRGIDERQRLARKSPLEVAREFEAILVAQVIGAMRKTVSAMQVLGGGAANKILDGAFDQQLARDITKDAHLGLAEQLAEQIERHEHAVAPETARAARAGVAGAVTPTADGTVDPADEVALAQLVSVPEAKVTSGYGVRRDPITGAAAFHGGIDVAAPRGSAIRAVAPGEVIFSGRRGRAGNVVEVRHGDLVDTYAHIQRSLVRAGQKVAAGDVLATVGSTGRSTGPHVHFQVSRDGQVIDPATVLGTGSPPATAAAERPATAGEA